MLQFDRSTGCAGIEECTNFFAILEGTANNAAGVFRKLSVAVAIIGGAHTINAVRVVATRRDVLQIERFALCCKVAYGKNSTSGQYE